MDEVNRLKIIQDVVDRRLTTQMAAQRLSISDRQYRRLLIDGCDHHWFENRAPACTSLVYVDDATSRLMQLRFVKSESTFTYSCHFKMMAWRSLRGPYA